MSIVLEKPALLTGEELLEMGDIGPTELIEGKVVSDESDASKMCMAGL
jgi:hypothetical protein